ncbi:MAG TPA: ribosome assembly RNA-binding protein YhbY [Polyangiaceae bacterium]|nr:ribosome assembly RNA-binding protein YhbY [Polyangiaceae bacterium]
MALTGKQRHHLRALAHHLEPVVHVGHEGVSLAVVAQIDAALAAHELIKVRVSADSPDSREETAELIAAGTHSEIAQIIGRIVVVFRRRATSKASSTRKKAKIALSPGGASSGQKGSKGRPPSQRAKAKAKTAAARAKKRQKLARAHSRAETRSRHGAPDDSPDE